MSSETMQKLDILRRRIDEQEKDNQLLFKAIASKCEHQQDNSGRHGMYAQIPACKASGIRTLKACDMDTCPAMH